ncbi:two-component system histidine kinase PnpS [Dethiothermospora halolimnae]|uniref:two-component system histidine kinase PnpS n=1 Tax=Dethiothermospora halolimnae TaxID=3114390 RepID=UPI003CCB9B45
MQKKIFLAFIILVLIGVFTTGFLALNLVKANYLNDIEDKLITNSLLIEEFLREENNFKRDNIDSLANKYSEKIDARVTFINKEGWVIGDSDVDIENLENHKERPEIKEAYDGEIGVSTRHSDSIDRDMLYVAIPFKEKNRELSVIRLSVPMKRLDQYYKTLFRYIVISMFSGLIIAFLLGFRYVNSVTDPIQQLTTATKKIADGNYGEKVYFRTEDELGVLADNFNVMSMKLDNTIDELQESNTKMKAILTSMLNGVIALDNSKKIMFINPTAEKMFNLKEKDVKGKYILEVVRNNILDDLIQNLIKDKVSSKEEIEIFEPEHKIFNVYSNPIALNSNPNIIIGVVIMIQDVTEIRKLERMRKDFVGNVSHELKTPLTSIKGFVETLKQGAGDNKEVRNKFLDILEIEANRLNALIEDLLLLSEIESGNNINRNKVININKSIDDILKVLNEVAKKKDITLIDKVNKNLPQLFGNEGWFKQMLVNLIDNGIKYTPSGGKVIITGYNVKDNLIIKVKDNGMGIEKNHLSRLFERFYRVDKARSRKIGGTGLGLAIVKHIVLSFDGKIDVKSKVGKGTEFIVTLPIKNKEL